MPKKAEVTLKGQHRPNPKGSLPSKRTPVRAAVPREPVVPLNPRQAAAADALKQTIGHRANITTTVGSTTASSRGQLNFNAGRRDRIDRKTEADATAMAGQTSEDQALSHEEWKQVHPAGTVTGDSFADINKEITDRAAKADADYKDPVTRALKKVRDAISDPIMNLQTQAHVGGTKGSTAVVDRSEAVKKSWETRKKIYGPSGEKAK